MQAVLHNGRGMLVVKNWEYFVGEKFYCTHVFADDPIKCNNNLFYGRLSRTTQVSRYQKKTFAHALFVAVIQHL